MTKYRVYRTFDGKIYYLPQSQIGWTDHRHAGLFAEAEWRAMGGSQAHLQLAPIGEDEAMKLAGAPTLPGMEA